MKTALKIVLGTAVVLLLVFAAARLRPVEFFAAIWPLVEAIALDDFIGVTTGGSVEGGLFEIRSTGVSTEPVVAAAKAYLDTLTPEQRQRTLFSVDDDEWRRWANIHISGRQGVSLGEMNDAQQAAAWALVASGLSVKGFELARDITRLEEHLAELMDDHYEYGEHRYWITVMGEPSATEPWGWQFEGHHLIVNFFVLGDQVVMTPTFMGSEPVVANSGKYAGTRVLHPEQESGLALINALTDEQRARAVIAADKPGNNNYGELFSDNAVVPIEGLPLSELSAEQRPLAEQLINVYVGRMRPGHADVWLADVRQHWADTRLAWVGGTDADSVFYYRLQSPVLMIEFDHQSPVALERPDAPTREHVHTVVRTPNGNDYGKDLLRQHLADHPH